MKNSSSSSPLTSLTPLPYQTLTLILAPILSHLSFSSSSNLTSTLPMDSGLDFADVFGGPPRRSSISDSLRRSPADSLGSGYWRGSGYGYGSRSGSGLGEKPVFGEISSPARRRHLKDDFFSDIFQSSESACSSPRKAERDSFNSPSSSSRILSPTRPLPPIRSEVVDGRSSLPTQLSPSMKLVKGVDHALNSSYKDDDGASDTLPFSPATIKSSYPTQTINAQDDLKTDGHVSYRQSPLSRQFFDTLDQSSEFMDSTGVSIKNHSQKDPTTLESYVSKGQFHFSIYKWAGKGVTLIMPSKSNLQHDSRFKILPEVVVQEVDVILHEDNTSTLTSAYKSLSEDISIEGKDDSDLTTAKHLPAEFEAKFLHIKEIEKSDMRGSNDEEAPVTVQEVQKHELKVLRRLFDGDLDKQQNEEIIRQVEGKEDLSTGLQGVYENINVKQQSRRENKRNSVKVSSPTMRDAPVPQEEKMLGSRVKGKVKDFINKFNQELSPKRKGTFNRSSEKSRGKDEGKVPDQVFISTNREDERVKHNSRSYDSTLPGTPVPIINLEKAEKENSDMSFAVHMLDDDLSERSDPLRQFSDSTPDILDASVCDIEESHFEDLEGYLVEPLYHDQNKDEHSDSHQDQIKIINDKVQQWSKGKDGNIRSLLSTLQYVLWPESGWKPVPLVDIIEGSSVKRAYQKALLSLHPDKLQQKGASVHQKYTAEKVFDILQEAWDHFNQMTEI